MFSRNRPNALDTSFRSPVPPHRRGHAEPNESELNSGDKINTTTAELALNKSQMDEEQVPSPGQQSFCWNHSFITSFFNRNLILITRLSMGVSMFMLA
jgi:hypothetical protein